ncbi:flagellar biosynthesis anti-sigma factor FlgM [Paraliobacillus ryukyuensis]|uniref:flagellar biosynthesis anti-sigma factor FlgM n=1 Tax=Paraliobacillus ryukyuensis TaxID=200904 RepID=UPI0009A886D7|nr:flagellar biosynthesis anti-sigma factor FlgM [Paraliobacillus ryukyuensis]
MKIYGPNHTNFNPYQKQMNKQSEIDTSKRLQSDKLQISEQAMKMQESDKVQHQREARVNEIKQAVENGTYEIAPKQTAEKLLQFWK